jgi:hypothetical protein
MVKLQTVPILLLLLVLPVQAQDVPMVDAPPANLAAEEEARTRMCVEGLARLAEVDQRLAPFSQRLERIETIFGAVTLEDASRAEPFDAGDPLERAVQDWFQADEALAARYADAPTEELAQERRTLREEIQTRLQEAHGSVSTVAQQILDESEDLGEITFHCQGAVFVRSVVLEACESTSSPLCEPARAAEPQGPFRFVDDAADLWDVEQLRPWADPVPLRPMPDGTLDGASTNVLTRRGNVTLMLGIEPIIQPRSSMDPEQAARFDENLGSLGFDFDHPDFVMAPAVAIQLRIPGPLGGETHYLVHFGEIEDPDADVLWASAASRTGMIEGLVSANAHVLDRLAAGHEVFLTAVRAPEAEEDEEAPEGEAIYSLGLTSVGQAQAVGALLAYMADGGLSADLREMVPPGDAADG